MLFDATCAVTGLLLSAPKRHHQHDDHGNEQDTEKDNLLSKGHLEVIARLHDLGVSLLERTNASVFVTGRLLGSS